MDDRMAEIMRGKSVDDCLRMLDGMWLFVRDMVAAGVRHDHPDWDKKAVEREVASRLANASD
jgi:hypothetical protein